MDTLDLVLRGALIGVGGSALMDVWGWVARRAFRVKGLDYALLGRWIGHLPRGRFSHASIASATPVTGERALGWVGHYSIGVAFAFLLLLVHGRQWTDTPTLWPALLVGWVTVLAPWLIMQPGMGAGIAASRTPRPGAARLRNVASHTAYGLGLYASAVALASL
ncbi:DUF2938 domain-containing protein [Ornithinimicrobium cryptoxanthini]|uniref:DUF2938 domain-containing protein n=1 Tax=Ornithinimicrobium cryptoxanthini TaxID=2934161 RepID=UPI002117BE0F|nr:DUF2938 domain-containing protein [Ornithinimicrobium cryptoxanthini]